MKCLARSAFALFVCIFCTRADQIVVPADRATQSGSGFIIDPFGAPGTIDSVYGARNFSGPVQIDGMSFRLDETSAGTSFDTVIPKVTIRMSTYSGTFSSYLVGPGYNGNKGADDTTVFDAAVHWTAADLPGSGPNPFDLKIIFSKPFLYDPAKGGLLMDFTTTGQFTSGIRPDVHGHGDSSFGWIGDKSLANIVTEFNVTAIPEPSTHLLLFSGVLVCFTARMSFKLNN